MTSPPTPPHRGPSFRSERTDTDVTGEVPLIPFDDDGDLTATLPSSLGAASSSAKPASTAVGDEPPTDGADDPDYDDDEDFAPRARQRYGLLSGLLVLVLAIALGFLGGEIVQKHYGTAASASGITARRGALAGGEGGFAGFGGGAGTGNRAGAGTGGGTGAGAGTGAGTGTTTTAVPSVIGTVSRLSATTLVVKNLGGKSVTVHLTTATTVTVSLKNKALKVGQTVAVVGTTAKGVVTARSVVVQ